jgi:uridine phosphorylase
MEQKKSSELVLSDGKVYHLDLNPEQISETIILVGDQFRVPKVSAYFDNIEHQVQKREFLCHTGTYKGKRISVVSTGIGTDNVDIVLNELDALFNFDLEKRQEKAQKTSLNFVRIGTCGALHPEIMPGSFVLSTGSFGLDNVAHFYEIENTDEERNVLNAFIKHVGFPETLIPYFTFADAGLNAVLAKHPNVHQGLTVTASGFYGPQGRRLRLPLKIAGLNDAFASFQFQDYRTVNFEMESSAIFALSRGLNHRAATICVALANRATGAFLEDYDAPMNDLIQHVLNTIADA